MSEDIFFKKIVIILFSSYLNQFFFQNYQNIRFTNLQYRSKTWYLRLIHKINWFIKMFILNENIWCQSQFINKKLVFAFIFQRKYRMLQNLIFAVTKTTSFDRKCGVVISISLRTINQTNIYGADHYFVIACEWNGLIFKIHHIKQQIVTSTKCQFWTNQSIKYQNVKSKTQALINYK